MLTHRDAMRHLSRVKSDLRLRPARGLTYA